MSNFSGKVPLVPMAYIKDNLNQTNISEDMTAAERTTSHSKQGVNKSAKLSNNFMNGDSISIDNSIRH